MVINTNMSELFFLSKQVSYYERNFTEEEFIADHRTTLACSLAVLVGVIQILMGFFGLGIVASYFSDTFISSYTCGSAIHVVVSQIKELLGLKNIKKFDGPFKIPRVNKRITII